ncbi:DUF2255 family protein [Streptomyces nigra]|uniref:DUF2255 family protein n=1 Tax=Streptomyces nigra TaxID=1827580 RepID=UPI0036360F53
MSTHMDPTSAYLDRTDTVWIATPLATGQEKTTPIWAVVVEGTPYIRSGLGPDAKWYRRALRAGRAAFLAGPRRLDVALERVTDAALDAAVDQAYQRKYGPSEPTRVMTASPARETTLRVLPLKTEADHAL